MALYKLLWLIDWQTDRQTDWMQRRFLGGGPPSIMWLLEHDGGQHSGPKSWRVWDDGERDNHLLWQVGNADDQWHDGQSGLCSRWESTNLYCTQLFRRALFLFYWKVGTVTFLRACIYFLFFFALCILGSCKAGYPCPVVRLFHWCS